MSVRAAPGHRFVLVDSAPRLKAAECPFAKGATASVAYTRMSSRLLRHHKACWVPGQPKSGEVTLSSCGSQLTIIPLARHWPLQWRDYGFRVGRHPGGTRVSSVSPLFTSSGKNAPTPQMLPVRKG